MELFKLVGKIFVDSDEANKSISKTDKNGKSVAETLGKGIQTAAKWAAGLTAAATAVGTAMVSSAKDSAANMDVIDKASIRMGIGAESYQELAHAAGLCGVEMSTMEKAAKKLEGTDLNLDQALDQLMAIDDETERTNAAISMFGEAVAYQMTPLLRAGADGLADMKQEANDLGLVMSQDTVSAGAAMNDQFSRITEMVTATKNEIGAAFMPVLTQVIDKIIEYMPMVQGLIEKLMPVAEKFLDGVLDSLLDLAEQLLPPIMDLIEQLLPFIQKSAEMLLPLITKLMTALLPPLVSLAEKLLPVLLDLLEPLMPLLEPIFDLLEPFADLLLVLLEPLIKLIDVIVPALEKSVIPLLTSMFKNLKQTLNDIKISIQPIVDWIVDKVGGIGDAIASVGSFFGGVGEKVAGFFGGSHASGLEYVPYDGYTAVLHRGEKVLTADQASGKSQTSDNSGLESAIRELSQRIGNMSVTLDGDAVVGGIAGRMNTVLGNQRAIDRRGVLA